MDENLVFQLTDEENSFSTILRTAPNDMVQYAQFLFYSKLNLVLHRNYIIMQSIDKLFTLQALIIGLDSDDVN